MTIKRFIAFRFCFAIKTLNIIRGLNYTLLTDVKAIKNPAYISVKRGSDYRKLTLLFLNCNAGSISTTSTGNLQQVNAAVNISKIYVVKHISSTNYSVGLVY